MKETVEHWQEDMVIKPATQVICFTRQQAWCPSCERRLIQAAPGELLGSAIGPVAKPRRFETMNEYEKFCRVGGVLLPAPMFPLKTLKDVP